MAKLFCTLKVVTFLDIQDEIWRDMLCKNKKILQLNFSLHISFVQKTEKEIAPNFFILLYNGSRHLKCKLDFIHVKATTIKQWIE